MKWVNFLIFCFRLFPIFAQQFKCISHLEFANNTIDQCLSDKSLKICDLSNSINKNQSYQLSEKISQISKISSNMDIFKNCSYKEVKGILVNIVLVPFVDGASTVSSDDTCNAKFLNLTAQSRIRFAQQTLTRLQSKKFNNDPSISKISHRFRKNDNSPTHISTIQTKRKNRLVHHPISNQITLPSAMHCNEHVLFLVYGNNIWVSLDHKIKNLARRHVLFRFLNSFSTYENFSTEDLLILFVSGFLKLSVDAIKAQTHRSPQFHRLWATSPNSATADPFSGNSFGRGTTPKLIFKSKTIMGIIGFLCVLILLSAFFCAAFMRSHLSRYFATASPAMLWQLRRKK